MRVFIRCNSETAERYHRTTSELIETEPTDTVEDIKIKMTFVYLGLSTNEFELYTLHGKKLNNY